MESGIIPILLKGGREGLESAKVPDIIGNFSRGKTGGDSLRDENLRIDIFPALEKPGNRGIMQLGRERPRSSRPTLPKSPIPRHHCSPGNRKSGNVPAFPWDPWEAGQVVDHGFVWKSNPIPGQFFCSVNAWERRVCVGRFSTRIFGNTREKLSDFKGIS